VIGDDPRRAVPPPDAEELVGWLPDIVFSAAADGGAAIDSALESLAAAVDAPPELSAVATRMARLACGEGGGPCPPSRLVKCGHNHITVFRWRGRDLAHKLYGNPWGCVRECGARLWAARYGLEGVDEPLCVVKTRARGRLLAAAVFPWCPGPSGTAGAEAGRELGRALGRWTRSLHDSLPERARCARRARPFSLRHNRIFDLDPLIDSPLAPPRHWQTLEEISRHLLAEAGDEGDSLVHSDLGTPDNVRISPREGVERVLDFEFAQIGYRAMDLLWIHEKRGPAFAAFLEGYDWAGAKAVMPLLELWGSLSRVVEAAGYTYNPNAPCACPHPAAPMPELLVERVRQPFAEHRRELERWS
jgi:hypothetical protein